MNEAAEALAEPEYFCGAQPEQLNRARARIMRWSAKRELKWSIADRVAGITIEQQIEDTAWSLNEWHEASNGFFTFQRIDNAALADIVLTTRRIDRPGGVLAEMQLPPGDDRQLIGWMDTSERWGQAGFYRAVILHELGHAMGLDHITNALAVLNPTLNMALKGLQAADVQSLLAIYQEAVNYKPTQPGPVPTPGTPTGPATPPTSVTINGFVATFPGGLSATYGPAVHTRIL
jgi:hypothetical protein